MKFFKIILITLLVSSCNIGVNVTVHDEDGAGEITSSIIRRVVSDDNVINIYQNATEAFQKKTKQEEFIVFASQIKAVFFGSNIVLNGYETYGTQETIAIHGISKKADKEVYFKFTYAGTLSKGYKVQGLSFAYEQFKKEGAYIEYKGKKEFEI